MIRKGALEPVLSKCGKINQDQARVIRDKFAEWSGKGLRVLGVSTKEVPEKHPYTHDDEQGMSFAGFLLFTDPPKAGVKETIAALNHLGVQIKIITGDNKLVAQHAAEIVGLPVT